MFTTIVLIGLFILAGLSALGTVFFLVRSLAARSGVKKRTYGVERQYARQEMLIYAFTSAGLLFLMLVFCGFGTLTWFTAGADEEGTTAVVDPELSPVPDNGGSGVEIPLENGLTATPLPEDAAQPTLTATPEPDPPDDTPPGEPPTPTPLPTATVEPTPELATAVVDSPFVGLYLRTVPGGEIVERLEDQAVVFLLGPEQLLDDVVWVEVTSAESGNSGWVAADFLAEGGAEAPPPASPDPETEDSEG